MIRGKFPAEILPFLFEKRPKVVATVSSTAIYSLQPCFERTLNFNYEFSHYKKQFKYLHRYSTAFDVAEGYAPDATYSLGVNPAISNNFLAFTQIKINGITPLAHLDDFPSEAQRSVIIIDDCAVEMAGQVGCFLERISENALAIFINSDQEFHFYSYDHRHIWNHITPICIRKTRLRDEDIYDSLDDEFIYCFCKGGTIMLDIKERRLPHTGVTISATTPSSDSMQAKALEGILKATEQRLLYYINANNELEKRLKTEKGE